MMDVKPIVSFDEGHQDGLEPSNSQVLAALNGEGSMMSISAAQPGPDGTPGGKICVCHLCHLTFTAYSSLRRHMQVGAANNLLIANANCLFRHIFK